MSENTSIKSTEGSQPESAAILSKQAWQHNSANPFNWPKAKKWRITLTTASVTLLVGLNATAIATPSPVIAERFHVIDEKFSNSFWPVTAWNTAAALVPLVGLSSLENFGSRRGYLLSYVAFTIFVIPQAVAPNFATLLVARAIAGGFGGILQNAMDMFIADIWLTDEDRNLPITIYILALISGVTLGPVFGAITHDLSWRWVFYIQMIAYGALFPLVFLIVDETRGHLILSRCAREDSRLVGAANAESKPSIFTRLYEAIIRPAHLLCTEPVVFFFTLWSSFSFGLVFISTQSVAQVYSNSYGFSDASSGLVQVALFIGELAGFVACFPQNRYYLRSAARNPVEPGVPIPEARLPLSILASLLGLAGGHFWYAWASYSYVHWIVPTLGLAFIGFGIMVIVTTVSMYITDAYTKYAGSAIAAIAFGENMFAAWLPFAAKPMYTVLGFQWASSLLGFVALVLTLASIALLWKGERIRERSQFIRKASFA